MQTIGNLRFFLWQMIGLCCVLAAVATSPPTIAQTSATLSDEALVQALRKGGYTIYFRHVATEWSQSDRIEKTGDWDSCDPARMRQLSAQGRLDAQTVGAAMRTLTIPVGQVLSSPYCRCMETAKQMGLGPVEASLDLMNLRAAEYFGGREAIVKRARRRLSTAPAEGRNTVLVAHGNLARAATSVYPGEGEGLVFQAQADGGFVFIGRLSPVQWQQLAQSMMQ